MNRQRSIAALRVGLLVLAGLLSGLSVAWLRAAHLGNSALVEAEAAFDRGDLRVAIRGAKRAAAMRVPGAGHVHAAYTRLFVIARGAEAAGKSEIAIEAWEAVRGAILESRLPFSPPPAELDQANQNLARLRAESSESRESLHRARALTRELMRALEPVEAGTGSRTLFVGLGFVLAVAGCVLAGLRGLSRDGRLRTRELVLSGMLLSVGVACWTFAVGLA